MRTNIPTILFELLEVLGTKDFYRVVIKIELTSAISWALEAAITGVP